MRLGSEKLQICTKIQQIYAEVDKRCRPFK